jgi:hypothetical protein
VYPTELDLTTSEKKDAMLVILTLYVLTMQPAQDTQNRTTKAPLRLRKGTALVVFNKGTKTQPVFGTMEIAFCVWNEDVEFIYSKGMVFHMLNPKRDLFKGEVVFTPSVNRGCIELLMAEAGKEEIIKFFETEPVYVPVTSSTFVAPAGFVFAKADE